MVSEVPGSQEDTVQINRQNPSSQTGAPILDPVMLEQISLHKVKSLTAARGELFMPCIPSLSDRYTTQVDMLLRSLGQNFTPKESESLQHIITQRLNEGFAQSPYARLVFKFEPPSPTEGLTNGLRIQVAIQVKSTEDKYAGWVQQREGPLFGSHADARVMAIASNFESPASCPILDVGSGPGRNTLPLAKKGYPIDALELAPVFVEQLRAAAEGLPVTVTLGDVLALSTPIATTKYKLAIAAELISHFRNLEQVRVLLTRLSEALVPGGILLFSTFLTVAGYEPSPMIRELSQVAWSFIITPAELAEAMQGLPLEIISNESAWAYEREHLPPEAWPPTRWFTSWATGRDLFPVPKGIEPPMSLRWILCRRT